MMVMRRMYHLVMQCFVCGTWQKSWLEHEHSVTAWVLSVHPDVQAHWIEQFSAVTGNLRMSIDEVVSQLHSPPCPDKKEHWQNFGIFWEELKHFTYIISPHYYFSGQFENEDAIEWCTHIWYEMHSIPFTKVLGFVACWNTSQHLSMGSAEQYWSDLNMIRMERGKILVADLWKTVPYCTLLLSLTMRKSQETLLEIAKMEMFSETMIFSKLSSNFQWNILFLTDDFLCMGLIYILKIGVLILSR